MENRDWMRSFPLWPAVVLVLIFYFLFSACLHAQNAKKEKVDMLVAGGTVVTMNAERRIIEDGAVGGERETNVAGGSRAGSTGKETPAEENKTRREKALARWRNRTQPRRR